MYICNDEYAEIAGVSITSLCENNNCGQLQLTIYILGVNISMKNQKRFKQLADQYGHEIILIDASGEYEIIKNMNLSDYRGSAMTNLRLRFDKLIPNSVQRLLYIDCDTIITDSLLELCSFDLEGKLLGMAMDAYGKIFDCGLPKPYYNAGVLLIDCVKWRKEKWRQKIGDFIKNNNENLAHPDQDVLNIVCADEIATLPIRYNFQIVHREYNEHLYFKHLAPNEYYTGEEIEQARENPVIVHQVRFLGTNPWYHDGYIHPDYPLYSKYKEMSLWKQEEPKKIQVDFVIRCERILDKVLTKEIFFPVSLAALRFASQGKGKNKY